MTSALMVGVANSSGSMDALKAQLDGFRKSDEDRESLVQVSVGSYAYAAIRCRPRFSDLPIAVCMLSAPPRPLSLIR
jgi:hypothetical protein